MSSSDYVVDICRSLIQIDTRNYGEGKAVGETEAVNYIIDLLPDSLEYKVVHRSDKRPNLIVNIPGTNNALPPLLIHMHLDTVPTEEGWSFDPLSATIHNDYIYGRGAIDMKNMVASVLSILKDRFENNKLFNRPLLLLFLADEEAGGYYGAEYIIQEHKELLKDVKYGIGEFGGFSVPLINDKKMYLVNTAEKGVHWIRVHVNADGGHGSMVGLDNPINKLNTIVNNINKHIFIEHKTKTIDKFFNNIKNYFASKQEAIDHLEYLKPMLLATLRNTIQPTIINSGYKVNVVAKNGVLELDCRYLPGYKEELLKTLSSFGIDKYDIITDQIAIESEIPDDILNAMQEAISKYDDDFILTPFMCSGGTDAKSFYKLGIPCFGFSPLVGLDSDYQFLKMFHGTNERVPIGPLKNGTEVLDQFLDLY